MVTYGELPDEHKESHRGAAAESIKLIICAGCLITQQTAKEHVKHTKVPNELLPLLELIAYHLHEVWCKAKVDKGYKYGIIRSESEKTHPDILPYYLLEVEDRYFDQNSAEASIMYILNSGCSISAPRRGNRCYETDYNDSVYFNELQRQIKSLRHNLACEEKLKKQWGEGDQKYSPEPLDLDAVRIPSDVTHLIEICAESMHDSWMEMNQRQGWSYGEVSDHIKKSHPAMLPYADLPIDLRRSDQLSAEQTLRSILVCGYTITKANVTSGHVSTATPTSSDCPRPNSGGEKRRKSWFDVKRESSSMKNSPRKSIAPSTDSTTIPHVRLENQAEQMRGRGALSLESVASTPVATPRGTGAPIGTTDSLLAESLVRMLGRPSPRPSPRSSLAEQETAVRTSRMSPPSPMLKSRDPNMLKSSAAMLPPIASRNTPSGRATIPPELQELIEVIAYHLHETWSQEKIKAGFAYAAVRNNALKHHPNLVPYYILSPLDRAYDLGIAEDAIICVLKAGCKIEKPARILVGDLISEEFRDKWAVTDQAMDAAIEEDDEIKKMIKLMDASETLQGTLIKKGIRTESTTVKLSRLQSRTASWVTQRRQSIAKIFRRNSLEILYSATSKLEDGIHKMGTASDKRRIDPEEEEEHQLGSQLSCRHILRRFCVALFRILFDYRLPISPELRLVRGWGVFMTISTLYFILAMPVRLGFVTKPDEPTMVLECALEMCFLYDLNIQSRLGFFNSAGEMVMDVAVIRRNYIRQWLCSDLIASVPVQTLEFIAGDVMADMIFMKLLRLLKILRMFRLSNKRSSLMSQTPSFMRMVQLLAAFIGGLHYMSCIYWATALQIGFDDDPDHAWVPDTSFHDAPFSEKCK
jgi:hypothetical protein